jgi:hypothetical protein
VGSTWNFLGSAIEADWLEAWATVVGSVGTVGTLIYAAVGLARERSTRRAELARIEKEQHAAQESQARTVVVHSQSIQSASDPEKPYLSAKVGNYGTSAITGVACLLLYVDAGKRQTAGEIVTLPVLRAGQEQELKWPLSGAVDLKWISVKDLDADAQRFDVEVSFNDAYGARWTTDDAGITRPSPVYLGEKEERLKVAEQKRKENLSKLPDMVGLLRRGD